VLQLIAEGKSTKDVASLLGITVKTAESQPHSANEEAEYSRDSLVLWLYAVRRGIVSPELSLSFHPSETAVCKNLLVC